MPCWLVSFETPPTWLALLNVSLPLSVAVLVTLVHPKWPPENPSDWPPPSATCRRNVSLMNCVQGHKWPTGSRAHLQHQTVEEGAPLPSKGPQDSYQRQTAEDLKPSVPELLVPENAELQTEDSHSRTWHRKKKRKGMGTPSDCTGRPRGIIPKKANLTRFSSPFRASFWLLPNLLLSPSPLGSRPG